MEIIKKEDNGIEFYTIDLTGQSGMSQKGLAILVGVSRTTIQNLVNTLATSAPSKWLEAFVDQPLTLATSDDPLVNGKRQGNLIIYKSSFCGAVIQHYADPDLKLEGLSKRQQEIQKAIATRSCLSFIETGINSWIQDITGWKQRSQSLMPHTDIYIQRIQHMKDHKIADDRWMIFREASELLLLIEKDWRVPINDYDILDSSIGKMWSKHRSDKSWIGTTSTYIHSYRDQRGERECAAYELSELCYFRKWLRDEYTPLYLPKYLVNKYGKMVIHQIYTEIGLLTDYILEITEIKRLTSKEKQLYEDFQLSRQKLLGGF